MPIETEQITSGSLVKRNQKITPGNIEAMSKTIDFIVYVLLILVATAFFVIGQIYSDYLAYKQATYLDLRDQVQEQNLLLEELIRKQSQPINTMDATRNSISAPTTKAI